MGQASRMVLKNAIWASIEPSIDGYSKTIERLLDLLSDEQLREFHDSMADEGDDPTRCGELARLAEGNGWTAPTLALALGYAWDDLAPTGKTLAGVVARANADGEDMGWLEEIIGEPAPGKKTN